MANELTLSVSLDFDKNGVRLTASFDNITISVSGSKVLHTKQTVGTTAEALILGDIGVPGYILIVNRDTLNFVTIKSGSGADNSEAVVKLLPGEFALFRFATSTPYIKADTGPDPCEVEYWLVEA